MRKEKIAIISVLMLLCGTQLFGYRRCCYSDYAFDKPMTPLKSVVKSMPLCKQKPTYSFCCGDGISCCVYLHDSDKAVIKRELRSFNRSHVIDRSNVEFYAHKQDLQSKMVGLVLDDFQRGNKEATVQDVYVALGAEKGA